MRPLQTLAVTTGALAICLMAVPARAYDRWSVNRDATNCRSCHGNFRSSSYVSLSDGMVWGNLHDIHRITMVNEDCSVCHGTSLFPVRMSSSVGGAGMDPISCVGCHGRAEDDTPANPDFGILGGSGAGLRQHHVQSGVAVCGDCHQDAQPANYAPVGEDVLPVYYANPGSNHPLIPSDACNADGSENFAGATQGLDNNGDSLYDGDDPSCGAILVPDLASDGLDSRSHPNPFTSETVIRYSLPEAGWVRLDIYTVSGQLIRTLVNGERATGSFAAAWDGLDAIGSHVAPGVYFYRLAAGGRERVERIVLMP